jgi:hypothetical protein
MSNLEVPSRVSYANEAFMRLSGFSWVRVCARIGARHAQH